MSALQSYFVFTILMVLTTANCPKNCECDQQPNELFISCPRPTFQNEYLTIKLSTKGMQIDCENIPEYMLYTPELVKNDETELLTFMRCPLLQNETLKDVMTKLGATEIQQLRLLNGNIPKITRRYFAGIKSVTDLELTNLKLKEVPEDLLEDLKNLEVLTISQNQVVLPEKLFSPTPDLRAIDLGQNGIKTLPTKLFRNLTNLISLSLWSNQLERIETAHLKDLRNLKTLELMGNNLVALPEDIFVNLPNLSILSLRNNKLETFPEGIFRNNEILMQVNLENNLNLTELPEYFLANKTNLMEVALYSCDLMKIPQNVFWGSPNIESIYLNDNKLTGLKNLTFKDSILLKELHLEDNLLINLEEGIFKKTNNLTRLYLQNNRLQLEKYTFSGLENLKELYMSNNNLVNISCGAFDQFKNLKIIDLSNNNLQIISTTSFLYLGNHNSIFSHLEQLEKLYLQNNEIAKIYDDWHNLLLKIKVLNLGNNKITELKFADINFLGKNDVTFNLSNNLINKIDMHNAEILTNLNFQVIPSYSPPPPVITVDLKNNPIDCDCNLYDLVRYIDLTMDPKVRSNYNLKLDNLTCAGPNNYIGVQINQFKSKTFVCEIYEGQRVPKNCAKNFFMYRQYDNTFIMNCSHQELTEAPAIRFSRNRQLINWEVYLQGNKLTELPGPGMGYDNVTILDVSNNDIKEITWVPPRIKVLKLHNNNLTYLDIHELSLINHTSIVDITFHQNPWKCDCELFNFTKYLQEKFRKVSRLHNITCSENGRELTSLTKTELCPMPVEYIIITVGMLAFISISICIMAILYYRYKPEIKVWLYAHKLCLFWIKEDELDKDKLYDAFISFSHEDEDFVVNELLPNLEECPEPFKLCVHYRNWIPGDFITTNIAKSVEDSRRTVVVLSPSFLKSEWGKMEFRTAHIQALSEGRARVIVIIYGDIGPIDDLDTELKAYLTTNTYVEWGDPWFWEKLRYALPHPQKVERIQIEDKVDLMYEPSTPPIATTPPADSFHQNPLKAPPAHALNVSLINGALINNATNNKLYDVRSIV